MAEPIKFTTVKITCEGKGYTFQMQEGISIRDKHGKEFLFENGKWKVSKTDYNVGRNGTMSPIGRHFEEYEEYEGGFMGFCKTRKLQPDIELTKDYKQSLEAVMDNDGSKSDLTIQDIDMARQQYKAGQLTKDFAEHGVTVSKYQSDYSGTKGHKLQVNIKGGDKFRVQYFGRCTNYDTDR